MMKMFKCPVPRSGLFLLGLLLVAPLRADVNGDLAFSSFGNVDLNALAGGQVLQARSPLMNFQRGVGAQSLFVIDAPLIDVQNKLLHWNPATHPVLDVWLHAHLPVKPTVADFAVLATLPDNKSVASLVDATVNLDPANPYLQLSRNEAQLINTYRSQGTDKKTLFVNFWSQILFQRLGTFLGGGKLEPYAVSGGDIDPMNEMKSLVHSDPKVYGQFQVFLHQTPLRTGNMAVPGDVYCECFDVQGTAALGVGAIYQGMHGTPAPAAAPDQAPPVGLVPIGDGSVQSVDIEAYVNYGIYASVELEQLWPVTIDGRNETLIWRNDMVSTPNVAYLHGTERLASSMIMLQDVKQAVDAFRSEFAR